MANGLAPPNLNDQNQVQTPAPPRAVEITLQTKDWSELKLVFRLGLTRHQPRHGQAMNRERRQRGVALITAVLVVALAAIASAAMLVSSISPFIARRP